MHRTLSAAVVALLVIGTAAACSDDTPDPQPTAKKTTAQTSPEAATAAKKLSDSYTDKLTAVSDGAVSDCQSPSSTTCSNDLGGIMTVVGDLEKDIDANGGAARYPETTNQIAKMRAAHQEYKDNGCEGDPAADDQNSDCWGISNITIGSATLTMTLQTDELS